MVQSVPEGVKHKMELHIIPPLSAMEEQFQSIYQIHATALGFDPLQASFQAYQALRQAMLHDLDTYMSQTGEKLASYGGLSPRYAQRPAIFAIFSMSWRPAMPVIFPYRSTHLRVTKSFCAHTVSTSTISPSSLYCCSRAMYCSWAPGTVYAAGAFDRDCVRRSILLRRTRTQARFSILLEGDGPIATFLKHTVGAFGGNSGLCFIWVKHCCTTLGCKHYTSRR